MITAIDELLARMMVSPKGKAPKTPYFTPARVKTPSWQKPEWGRQFVTDTSYCLYQNSFILLNQFASEIPDWVNHLM